jgi:hypothetical protein
MSEEGKDELYETIQQHHLFGGETVTFRCPHCSKKLTVEIKSLEADEDMIEVFWGKDYKEIEQKRKKKEEDQN